MPPQDDPNSTVTPPALPKGGGATRGTGEKFAVQGFTGRGSFSMPLPITPGRAGFQPTLALAYDSSAGNGLFGLGWSLSLSSIFRKTDGGVPRYVDKGDKADGFLMSGVEDLVPLLDGSGNPSTRHDDGFEVTAFRPRLESAYSRIELHAKDGRSHWVVTTRDNQTMVFGRDDEHRIADPADPKRIFEWLIEEHRDDHGNVIAFEYKAEDLQGVARDSWEEARFSGAAPFVHRHLKHVRYGNRKPGVAGDWAFQVVLDYGEHDQAQPTLDEIRPWDARKDPFSTCRPGFELRTYRLCRRVLVFHDFPELTANQGITPQLVRSADLKYDDDPSLTKLTAVLPTGYRFDGATQRYQLGVLPPTAFEYTKVDAPSAARDVDVGTGLQPVPGVSAPGLWADVLGEGIPGALMPAGGVWQFKPNQGSAKLGAALAVLVPESIATVTGLDGQGPRPLVKIGELPVSGVAKQPSDDRWDPFVPYTDSADGDPNAPPPKPPDADARPDVYVAAGDSIRWARKKPGTTDHEEVRPAGSFREEDSGTELLFADDQQAVFLADMTGDGISDVVSVRDGNVEYWPNFGLRDRQRLFGPAKVKMGGAPAIPAFEPRRVRMADVDRSGTADLVYLGDQEIRIFRNLAGNGFDDGLVIAAPAGFSAESAQVVDLLGNGTCCLVWSKAPDQRDSPVQFIALTGDGKPHLLERIVDNFGLRTSIRYAPSTRFFLADKNTPHAWITRLPLPVQVVDRVETEDLIAGVTLTTTYSYRHGHFDPTDRELRGFGFVESRDAETLASGPGRELLQAPVVSRTWFHTGLVPSGGVISRQLASEYSPRDPHPPDSELPAGLGKEDKRQACRALKGLVLRREVLVDDGSPLAKTPISTVENSYRLTPLQPAKDKAPAVFRVDLIDAVSVSYDRSLTDHRSSQQVLSDPRIHQVLVLETDDFGNVVRSASVAYARRAPAHPEQARPFVTVNQRRVTNDAGSRDRLRLGVPVETREHELTGVAAPAGALWTVAELARAATNAAPLAFEADPRAGKTEQRLIGVTRHFYVDEGDPTKDLPLGEIGERALPRRSLRAAFTQGLLDKVYAGRLTGAVTSRSRYEQLDGLWWSPSAALTYDAGRFFLPVKATNPFGQESAQEYDAHALVTVGSVDPLGNRTRAEIDYRVMQPSFVTDANGNRSAVRFDALGAVVATALMGKDGAHEGDTLDAPTTAIEYDAFAFMRGFAQGLRIPCSVTTRTREEHGSANPRFQVSIAYADAFGQQLQTKAIAEPAPGTTGTRFVASGGVTFNNKKNPVKTFQPFFTTTSDYEDVATLGQRGAPMVQRYDALGRVARVDFPDGSFETASFDAWSVSRADRNDNLRAGDWFKSRQQLPAGDPRRAAADRTAPHDGTPTVTALDPLGHAFLVIADGGSAGKLETRTRIDVQSRARAVTDPLGRIAVRTDYDLLGRALHRSSMESGDRWIFPDVDDQPLADWDSRGHSTLRKYDALRRPTEITLLDGSGPPQAIIRTTYGEGQPNAAAHNLRGRVFQIFDAAGVRTNERYDFKGNLIQASTQLAVEYKRTIDWSLNVPLESERHVGTATFDALSRQTSATLPDGTVLRRRFNAANLLERVEAALPAHGAAVPARNLTVVERLDYNERGQPTTIVLGNGATTELTYDEVFRLARLATGANGASLQQLDYVRDPMGHVTRVEDGAQQTIYFRNHPVDARSDYTYDPLYRLIEASGREHLGQVGGNPAPTSPDDVPRVNLPHPGDGAAMGRYLEKYQYDKAGNLLELKHAGNDPANPGWARTYHYNEPSLLESGKLSNRLSSTTAGGVTDAYHHDAHGNVDGLPHLTLIQWDYADHLHVTARRAKNSGRGETTFYCYDAAGKRTRKVTESENGTRLEERIYLGDFEIHRQYEGDGHTIKRERQTVDAGAIALVETRTKGSDPAPARLARFQLGNHLGSAVLELDEQARILSYEEYYPFGSTSYQSVKSEVPKRYRYTGKERDEESGLYYNGARYYACWLGRWTACDPLGMVDETNLYVFAGNAPVHLTDPNGTETMEELFAQLEYMITTSSNTRNNLALAIERFGGLCYDTSSPNLNTSTLWEAFYDIKAKMLGQTAPVTGPPQPKPPECGPPTKGPSRHLQKITVTGGAAGLDIMVKNQVEVWATDDEAVEMQQQADNTFAFTMHMAAAGGVAEMGGAGARASGGSEPYRPSITSGGSEPSTTGGGRGGGGWLRLGNGGASSPIEFPKPVLPSESVPIVELPTARGRKVNAGGGGTPIFDSGWSRGTNFDGFNPARAAREYAEANGTPFTPHPFDPAGEPGLYYASHAEPQILYTVPLIDFFEVSKAPCWSCSMELRLRASAWDQPIVVLTPEGFHWYMPGGKVHR